MAGMATELLLDERRVLAESAFAELVVWKVPSPLLGSTHRFKYRLALVVEGVCVLRYDNEVGKGDHKHFGGKQVHAVQADCGTDKFKTIATFVSGF